MSRIAIALLCGAIAITPMVSFADSESTLEEIVIEMANTPQEHASLATYYREKATEARTEASRHEQMSRSYRAGKMPQRNKMKMHCKNISEQYTLMAEQFDALAKLHAEEAK